MAAEGEAELDENRKPTLIGVDSTTLEEPTKVAVNPVTLALIVEVA